MTKIMVSLSFNLGTVMQFFSCVRRAASIFFKFLSFLYTGIRLKTLSEAIIKMQRKLSFSSRGNIMQLLKKQWIRGFRNHLNELIVL